MGTRSLTTVKEDGERLVTLYAQFDGYPSGVGADLARFLRSRRLANGINGERVFNGAGCLAAQLVATVKTGSGGWYIEPGPGDYGQDYEYEIDVPAVALGAKSRITEIRVTVRDGFEGRRVFHGNVDEFAAFCAEEG